MEYSLLPISLTNIIDPTIFQDEIKSFFFRKFEQKNSSLLNFKIDREKERIRAEFSPWITTPFGAEFGQGVSGAGRKWTRIILTGRTGIRAIVGTDNLVVCPGRAWELKSTHA